MKKRIGISLFLLSLSFFNGPIKADCFFNVFNIKDNCNKPKCNNGQCRCTNWYTEYRLDSESCNWKMALPPVGGRGEVAPTGGSSTFLDQIGSSIMQLRNKIDMGISIFIDKQGSSDDCTYWKLTTSQTGGSIIGSGRIKIRSYDYSLDHASGVMVLNPGKTMPMCPDCGHPVVQHLWAADLSVKFDQIKIDVLQAKNAVAASRLIIEEKKSIIKNEKTTLNKAELAMLVINNEIGKIEITEEKATKSDVEITDLGGAFVGQNYCNQELRCFFSRSDLEVLGNDVKKIISDIVIAQNDQKEAQAAVDDKKKTVTEEEKKKQESEKSILVLEAEKTQAAAVVARTAAQVAAARAASAAERVIAVQDKLRKLLGQPSTSPTQKAKEAADAAAEEARKAAAAAAAAAAGAGGRSGFRSRIAISNAKIKTTK